MQHFTTLLLRFAISRMLLVGRAAAREETLTPVELVETVQVFSRLYLHLPDFPKEMNRALAGAGWEGLDRLFTLL